ncbi:MazG nucleotide pyrophosphohydrolase domain-containing protein [Legionella longbeachae]|uniref:Putative MazG family protein n=1 Tax=Legionella longbeachae serogroup 1 (strain NSW150) TaxID=661367 RepID=D3HNX5_LEGLN|nr:MazG nucleotide pyrophosphohydrolase domain-containing protein [Legionella longbeachae]VEE01115.1 nucleotide pyrophosphohydrolase [Legionella oakridgensis]HBD7398444.1 nucleoside triphosphate hydrolase [Legionella pneumophila]ARB92507.1 nucleoside triphosphate hydrolase [Legionella longbeachae]ARM34313.1 nucleoside triphosphate hydrolase [Legionella longbeachae]EEZ96411.1 MazG family protein [Legionella longbeachae D-4968]
MNLLEQVLLLEQEAADFGFQWETTTQIMEQIQSECMEISEHLQSKQNLNQSELQEEIGDLLHAVFSLCVYCQFSPQETLKKALDKFEHRLQAVKAVAKEKKLNNLQGQSFDELMYIWNLAKKRVG